MGKKGIETRARILDTAQEMFLHRGYGGTSLEQVISSVGLTKGAFFHHFNSKSDLARHLIKRFADEGIDTFNEIQAKAERINDDPLQQMLIIIGLWSELFENLTEPFPGCLLATYVYEMQLFEDDVRDIINSEFLLSRHKLTALIKRIIKRYPPRVKVDPVALADMFMSTFEGAFILSKALHEPDITVQQLRLYRSFIEALFRKD